MPYSQFIGLWWTCVISAKKLILSDKPVYHGIWQMTGVSKARIVSFCYKQYSAFNNDKRLLKLKTDLISFGVGVYKLNFVFKRLFIYPPPPAVGGITVTNEDLYCLNDGEFLNDVIIEFYIK